MFVDGNRIPERWHELESAGNQTFSIIETGFGSGLNFLNVAETWIKFQSLHTPAHLKNIVYTSIEGFPLSKQDLTKIISSWRRDYKLSSDLLDGYPLPVRGIYNFKFNTIELNLIFMPLDQALAEFEPKHTAPFDCLFLDGFAPKKNQSMWHPGCLRRLSYLCKPDSTFSTFTAASSVRRCMTYNGYTVKRRKGFGRKREMLTGTLEKKPNSTYKSKSPWFEFIPRHSHDLTTIAIIGAGVAGCATANALAAKGIKSVIIDEAAQAGGTCSELDRCIYSPLLSADFNIASQFYWHAYQHLHTYLRLQSDINFQQTGIYYAADTDNRKRYLSSAYRLLSKFKDDFYWLDPDATQQVIGLPVKADGLFTRLGGWINAQSLCENLINHMNIHCQFNTTVIRLTEDGQHWLIETDQGIQTFDQVVLCTGSVMEFVDRFKLGRLDLLKGQTTLLSELSDDQLPKTIINNGHYLIPGQSQTNTLLIGASYERATLSNNAPTIKADIDNLMAVRDLSGELDKAIDKNLDTLMHQKNSSSKCGVRLTTRDHLPIIGPVPDMDFYEHSYTDIIRHGRLKNCPQPNYINNLFINTAHGSRGVTASVLSAQIISSLITGTPCPVPTSLYQAVHPARFFVRDVKAHYQS